MTHLQRRLSLLCEINVWHCVTFTIVMHRTKLIIHCHLYVFSFITGVSAVSVGPNGDIVGCEEGLGRPRLSTFSPQHLSPGGYSPNQSYTASLRRGSNSRRHPVVPSSPTSPSASLPRGQHLCQTDDRIQHSVLTSPSPSAEIYGHYSPLVLPVSVDDQEASSINTDPVGEPVVGESLGVNSSDSDTYNPRTMDCSAGDSRSELDLRIDNTELKHNSIPPEQTIESR